MFMLIPDIYWLMCADPAAIRFGLPGQQQNSSAEGRDGSAELSPLTQ